MTQECPLYVPWGREFTAFPSAKRTSSTSNVAIHHYGNDIAFPLHPSASYSTQRFITKSTSTCMAKASTTRYTGRTTTRHRVEHSLKSVPLTAFAIFVTSAWTKRGFLCAPRLKTALPGVLFPMRFVKILKAYTLYISKTKRKEKRVHV